MGHRQIRSALDPGGDRAAEAAPGAPVVKGQRRALPDRDVGAQVLQRDRNSGRPVHASGPWPTGAFEDEADFGRAIGRALAAVTTAG